MTFLFSYNFNIALVKNLSVIGERICTKYCFNRLGLNLHRKGVDRTIIFDWDLEQHSNKQTKYKIYLFLSMIRCSYSVVSFVMQLTFRQNSCRSTLVLPCSTSRLLWRRGRVFVSHADVVGSILSRGKR